MATVSVFTCVKFAGPMFGADLVQHDLFKVERTEGAPIYGEYFLIPVPDGSSDFNIGIRLFGYLDRFNIGNPHRHARQQFTVEECAAAEKVIHLFFSNPDIFNDRFLQPARASGGVSFQVDWIVQKHPEPAWLSFLPSNPDGPIYLGDFLGGASTDTVTNSKGQIFTVEDMATQIRRLAVDAHALANVQRILSEFGVDSKGKGRRMLYRGSAGPLSAREAVLREANRTGSEIIDMTERGRLLINEGVIDAIYTLLVKYYQLQGLNCLAAVHAAHRAVGPEPNLPELLQRRSPQQH